LATPGDLKNKFPGWRIPDSVKNSVSSLCTALNGEPFLSSTGQSRDELGLTLHWERDEYQFLVEETEQFWPEFVEHEKLRLLRNRYPVVPGFNTKTRRDVNEFVEASPVPKLSPELFLKKPQTWKIKNQVPKDAKVLRYRSLNGKTYPVLKQRKAQ
jgi:hypothetical protein